MEDYMADRKVTSNNSKASAEETLFRSTPTPRPDTPTLSVTLGEQKDVVSDKLNVEPVSLDVVLATSTAAPSKEKKARTPTPTSSKAKGKRRPTKIHLSEWQREQRELEENKRDDDVELTPAVYVAASPSSGSSVSSSSPSGKVEKKVVPVNVWKQRTAARGAVKNLEPLPTRKLSPEELEAQRLEEELKKERDANAALLKELEEAEREFARAKRERKLRRQQKKARKALEERRRRLEEQKKAFLEDGTDDESDAELSDEGDVSSVLSTPKGKLVVPSKAVLVSPSVSVSSRASTPTSRGSSLGGFVTVGKDGKPVKAESSKKSCNARRRARQKAKKAASMASPSRGGRDEEQKEKKRVLTPSKGGFKPPPVKLPSASNLARQLFDASRCEADVKDVGVFRTVGTGALGKQIRTEMMAYKEKRLPNKAVARLLFEALVHKECKNTCVKGFLNTDFAVQALAGGCPDATVKKGMSMFAPASWRFLKRYLDAGNAPQFFYFTEATRETLKKWSQNDWREACAYLNDGRMAFLAADGSPLSSDVVNAAFA